MRQWKPIPMVQWGKDHWSTLCYIETRIMDYEGRPNNRHMRCDPNRHPQFAHIGSQSKKYPTRLKDGKVRHAHDDWDCVDDMINAGVLEWNGTGLYPVFKLTELGHAVAAELRRWKQGGGTFATFAGIGTEAVLQKNVDL